MAVPACVHLTHFATPLTRSWAPWGSVGLEIRRSRLEEVVSRFRPLEAVFGLQDHPKPIQVEELRSGGAGIVPHGRRRPDSRPESRPEFMNLPASRIEVPRFLARGGASSSPRLDAARKTGAFDPGRGLGTHFERIPMS